MYGEKAVQLLVDLKRYDFLPTYNDTVIQEVQKEIKALVTATETTIREFGSDSAQPEISSGLIINHTSVNRNKRAILAYLNYRAQKIKELRWELASSVLPPDLSDNLSDKEKLFFTEYDKTLTGYFKNFPELDLTTDLQHPPKDVYIEVRVLKDASEILTETGPVNLEKHTTHFLPRTAVEPLIKQGVLKHTA